MSDPEFDKWHLFGVEGCVHEHDDADQIRWNQADEVACDCTEYAEWEKAEEATEGV